MAFRHSLLPGVSLFPPIVAAATGVGLLALPGAFALFWPLLVIGLLSLLAATVFAQTIGLLKVMPWVLVGYLYGCWQIDMTLQNRLPLCADQEIRTFEVRILNTPVLAATVDTSDRLVGRFVGEVVIADDDGCVKTGRYQVRLSWYDPPELLRGDLWQAEGRLRPPWGNLNPGGFDYERWLLGEGLAGSGYVRTGKPLRTSTAPADVRTRLRSTFAEWLKRREVQHAGIMLALMLGDDSRLSQTAWRLLRDSGTVHLLVVSGLHVGLVSGFLFIIGRQLARLAGPLLLWIDARRLAGLFALAGSGAYVLLSGAGVPAVRAWLMSALVLQALASGRVIRGLNVVLLVMALVLVANPLVVHQQGFWLSFAAVLALVAWFEPAFAGQPGSSEHGLAGSGRVARLQRAVLAFAQVQLVLMFALAPLLASFQGGVPLQSPLVNALVVPLVTFLVLPTLLLAGLCYFLLPELADALLWMAEKALELVMASVTRGAAWQARAMSVEGAWQWLLMPLTLIVLCRRPGWRWLPVPMALWWALLLPDGWMPTFGEFRISALDVGQGSAIIVDTRHHRLIFDAGPRYASGFDLGDAVVVPSFQRSGDAELHMLLLSHDDVDHTGGASAVLEQLAPQRILASFPLSDGGGVAERCVAGSSWRWDGVAFVVMHPPPDWFGSDNDGSCVLRISNGRRSALLAGDISSRIERRLPKQPVDLLMAPHHGSRTSSSLSFVRGFAPAIVFVSTDRRSRYGHPHVDVVKRYRSAELAVTGRGGALIWSSADPRSALAHRLQRAAYWRRQLPVRP